MSYHDAESSLSEIQKDFIPRILEYVYPDLAAKNCGLDAHTMGRWMQSKAFRSVLDEQRKVMAQNVMFALEKYANRAVTALIELLAADKPDTIRIKAADSILNHTLEYRKVYGLEERMEAIEGLIVAAQQLKEESKS